jgi:hypothetical protein
MALGRFLIAAAGAELRDSLETNVQGFQLLSDDALRHLFFQVLYQQSHAAILGQLTPLSLLRNRSALTMALKPSAVDGTTINFSVLS